VTVIILGFNDRDHLPEALRSVLAQRYSSFRVMFVDNASSDRSIDLVKVQFPQVETVRLHRNIGYAGAYAMVLPRAFGDGCDCAVLLNADVSVEPDWLNELVQSAHANPSIGFAQPKILLWDGHRLNSFGNHINYLGFGYCGHCNEEDSQAFDFDREAPFVSGASMLVKRDAYLDSGGIDASFFNYVEDQDLVWRGRMLGWRSVVSARSRMRHKYQFLNPARNSRKMYWYELNRMRFVLQNYSALMLVLLLPAFCAMEALVLVHSALNGYVSQKCAAYLDLARMWPIVRDRRRQIQRSRKVSDRMLIQWLSTSIEFPGLEVRPGLAAVNGALSLYFALVKACLRLSA
jgi:GT2 family glycosyltransferase